MAAVTMRERYEAIIPFPRQELQPPLPRVVATIPMVDPPAGNIRVPLLRFIVDPAIERKLLVKAGIRAGKERTSKEFVSASLLRQLVMGELIDPRVPIEVEFIALEPLVLDCGFVCKLTCEVQ